jgi:hypothetical protein
MTNENPYEKYEKEEKAREQEEKSEEKTHEKQAPEKSWDEKWQRDPIGTLTWALILIWAGVALLLDNLGLLSGLGFLDRMDAWSMILAGAGVIILAMVVVRLLQPEYRRPLTGNLVLGFFLIGVGLGEALGWEITWAVLIIALGVTLLLRGFLRAR